MTQPILSVAFLLLFTATFAAQTRFHLDEPFTSKAKIPNPLLLLLRTDVKSICPDDAAFQPPDVRSLFIASRITLNHRAAYILKSGHHCLTGVDNDWFWIYIKTPRSYRLVLTSGSISLDVLRRRTHGLRDIETNACTGAYCFSEIYKFDSSVYKARTCSEAEMRGGPPKWHRVPCRH